MSPVPTLLPVPVPVVVVELTSLKALEEAVDYAARVSKATVAEFVAAPLAVSSCGGASGIEAAVEFLVPPVSARQFAEELDRALMRRGMQYSTARRNGKVDTIRVSVLPPGAFHQWRSAWRLDLNAQHVMRWSADRKTLEGVLRQAEIGWREIMTAQ